MFGRVGKIKNSLNPAKVFLLFNYWSY